MRQYTQLLYYHISIRQYAYENSLYILCTSLGAIVHPMDRMCIMGEENLLLFIAFLACS